MYRGVTNIFDRIGLAVQIGVVGSTLAFVSLSPPVRGEILLIPLSAKAAQRVAGLAIARDARLVGRGPFAGSLVVEGDRARLAGAMVSAGIVPIAARSALCGALAGAAGNG